MSWYNWVLLSSVPFDSYIVAQDMLGVCAATLARLDPCNRNFAAPHMLRLHGINFEHKYSIPRIFHAITGLLLSISRELFRPIPQDLDHAASRYFVSPI
jgi:hypothetical protein